MMLYGYAHQGVYAGRSFVGPINRWWVTVVCVSDRGKDYSVAFQSPPFPRAFSRQCVCLATTSRACPDIHGLHRIGVSVSYKESVKETLRSLRSLMVFRKRQSICDSANTRPANSTLYPASPDRHDKFAEGPMKAYGVT